MEATILTHKLLCVSNPQQCNVGIVILDALCAEEAQFNLSKFLLNELLRDAASTKDDGTHFHYAWLIIMISFIVLLEPLNYQQVELPVQCGGARYQNFWFSPHKG